MRALFCVHIAHWIIVCVFRLIFICQVFDWHLSINPLKVFRFDYKTVYIMLSIRYLVPHKSNWLCFISSGCKIIRLNRCRPFLSARMIDYVNFLNENMCVPVHCISVWRSNYTTVRCARILLIATVWVAFVFNNAVIITSDWWLTTHPNVPMQIQPIKSMKCAFGGVKNRWCLNNVSKCPFSLKVLNLSRQHFSVAVVVLRMTLVS